jgi:hypothetical protein
MVINSRSREELSKKTCKINGTIKSGESVDAHGLVSTGLNVFFARAFPMSSKYFLKAAIAHRRNVVVLPLPTASARTVVQSTCVEVVILKLKCRVVEHRGTGNVTMRREAPPEKMGSPSVSVECLKNRLVTQLFLIGGPPQLIAQ